MLKDNLVYQYSVPENYTIIYDKEKNYNEYCCNGVDDIYLPPYRSDFPSVYKGIEVEIQIVDHCNINCNHCNHFSPLAEPWCIDIDDYTKQLQALKNNINTVKRLLILGGEPTLHKNLFELCKIARNIFPDICIDVLSNGIILTDIEQHKQEYKKLNINFTFTYYPGYNDFEKLEKLNEIGRVFHSRLFSKETLVDPDGLGNKHNHFFNCINHKLPCLTLKDYKLYICPFCAHVDHYCKKAGIEIEEIENIDYLDINKINNNLDILQKFCFTPKNYCSYCYFDSDTPIFTKSKKDILEFTSSLYDLYFRDYSRYEGIVTAPNQIKETILKYNYTVDKDFEKHTLATQTARYFGLMDIIIPYYNEGIEQIMALRENLLSQKDIDKYFIYLISDNGNMDQSVINIFKNTTNLHCMFLRNEKQEGPGEARNIGLKNSQNNYVLFLDADDALINENSLNNIYQNLKQNDLITFESFNHSNGLHKTCFAAKTQFLKNNNLIYKKIKFCEDAELLVRALSLVKTENYQHLSNSFIEYNATKGMSITETFYNYDKNHFCFFSSEFIGLYEILKNKNYNQKNFEKCVNNFIDRIYTISAEKGHEFLLNDQFVRYLIFIELNYLYKYIDIYKYQQLCNLYNLPKENYINLDIIDYLILEISNNQLNNSYTKTNAEYLIKILQEIKLNYENKL